ncbi:MAG: hypothetical protein WKF32_04255 [Thermoleophilaceae bacterium]
MPDHGDNAPEPVEGELLPVQGERLAEVRPLPVPAEEGAQIERPFTVSVPATVIAASGGFVLGVAAFVLTRILRRPSAGRSLSRRKRRLAARRGVDIESTRSFLVDVHLLKR